MKKQYRHVYAGDPPHRVALITPLEGLAQETERIALDMKASVDIVLTPVDEELPAALESIGRGSEVIIGRGQVVARMKEVADVPVVPVEVSAQDILRCLMAFKRGTEEAGESKALSPVGVIGFPGFAAGLESLAALVEVSVSRLEVRSLEEVADVFRRASEMGIRRIVGSYGLVLKAEAHGFEAVTLKFGPEGIARALAEALRIAELRANWRERTEFVSSVLNATQDGIVALDPERRVTLMNPVAEQLFRVRAADARGRPLASLLPALNGELGEMAAGVFQPGQTTLQIGKQTVVVRYSPIPPGSTAAAGRGLLISMQDVTDLQRLERIARQKLHRSRLTASCTLDQIIAAGPEMQAVKQRVRKYAPVDASVLIVGETGTGKELVAQSIHNSSARADGPFVAVNCAALPEPLLESELFGYEEGAFTGARRGGKQGLFELAHGGSLFLDEVGEMSLAVQTHLLRILQDKMLMRIGGSSLIPVDVRIIAATNRDVLALTEEGLFRQDLYYRLNTLPIAIPPLRSRPGDVVELAAVFLAKHSQLNPRVRHMEPELVVALTRYSWPGNARELEHVIERMMILCEGDTLRLAELDLAEPGDSLRGKGPAEDPGMPPPASSGMARDVASGASCFGPGAPEDMELHRVLIEQKYHMGRTARQLGISRTTLWRRLKRNPG